ncbi:MAG TPA: hypothetical protein VLM85_01215, partial [Polyangiaceae bacterium]|nr:hypothetical protein [Polyangiaceae bacterium]
MRNRFAVAIVCVAFMALFSAPDARAVGDPNLKWEAIETAHFRVTYYSSELDLARRVADLAESILGRLAPAVGWPPSERVEISIVDTTDSANAFAGALPYDSIRMFATAPDDLSPLGDVDDWYLELITHEFTHVLHTDHIRGLPAVINAVLGKTLSPNQIEPRWILEGLAVFEESSKTSGGRLRSSLWNMMMRADVLEHNVAPLDVFSNDSVRRWPGGDLWYLYGSFFMQWIAETYGEQAIRVMIDDYGHQIIPYGINRSIRRATGRTYEELFPAFVATLEREFGEQAAEVRSRGVREGTRITFGGYKSQNPRFIPVGAWPNTAGDIVYTRDDGHDTAGVYHVPIRRDKNGAILPTREHDIVARTLGGGTTTFLPDGSYVFDSIETYNNLFGYTDLFWSPKGERSPSGLESHRVKLTDGFRAYEPDVSPDGKRVVFATNHHGTSHLQIADLDVRAGTVAHVHELVHSARFDQAYAPRWSSDNRHVAYSSWTKGGYRDVRIVDTTDGSFEEVAHDRAIDGGPSFSPDGKRLYFHSDRAGGIMNVFVYDLANKTLKQVTNSINGAMQPAISADEKTLVYLGYTHEGYDLFAMDLDPSKYLDALPYVDDRPPPPPEPQHVPIVHKSYNPLDTFIPRHYLPFTTQGNFGQAIGIGVSGGDIAGLHSFNASLWLETDNPQPQFNVSYTYGRLPFDMSLTAYRSIAPGSSFSLGKQSENWVQDSVGGSASISYSIPRAFESHSFSLSYSVNSVSGDLGFPSLPLDPYDTPHYPQRLLATILSAGWSYSNAQSYLWSVSAEKGFSVSASLDVTHPVIGSDYRGFRAHGDFTTYLRMPWLRHHVVALHAGGGMGGGFFPGGPFYVGGFIDLGPQDQIQSFINGGGFLYQSGVALRGYPVATQTGSYYLLGNAEYR